MEQRTPVWVGVLGWVVALLIYLPIFWTYLNSFTTEIEDVSTPPSIIF